MSHKYYSDRTANNEFFLTKPKTNVVACSGGHLEFLIGTKMSKSTDQVTNIKSLHLMIDTKS